MTNLTNEVLALFAKRRRNRVKVSVRSVKRSLQKEGILAETKEVARAFEDIAAKGLATAINTKFGNTVELVFDRGVNISSLNKTATLNTITVSATPMKETLILKRGSVQISLPNDIDQKEAHRYLDIMLK